MTPREISASLIGAAAAFCAAFWVNDPHRAIQLAVLCIMVSTAINFSQRRRRP